ncbi:MAG TPA: hypothetical protein PKI00_00735 [Candidatus Pacearchaeota archaeon]|nr:hypothetical protein [Candidatus Pacearchaeota archaeon]
MKIIIKTFLIITIFTGGFISGWFLGNEINKSKSLNLICPETKIETKKDTIVYVPSVRTEEEINKTYGENAQFVKNFREVSLNESSLNAFLDIDYSFTVNEDAECEYNCKEKAIIFCKENGFGATCYFFLKDSRKLIEGYNEFEIPNKESFKIINTENGSFLEFNTFSGDGIADTSISFTTTYIINLESGIVDLEGRKKELCQCTGALDENGIHSCEIQECTREILHKYKNDN